MHWHVFTCATVDRQTGCLQILAFASDAFRRFGIQVFVGGRRKRMHTCAFLLYIYLGVELLIHWVQIYSASLDTTKQFCKVVVQSYSPTTVYKNACCFI